MVYMNTSKALKRLLLLLFLSFTGPAYPHKPVSVHTHTGDATELLEKLRARPEYRELAEQFSLVTNPYTRTGKNVPAKTRRQALISCMTTLEKLEETYPSPLLTDVATWCSTEFKQRKKLAPWMRNAIIIGSSAAAAALALAAIWYWRNNQSPRYPTEKLIDFAPEHTPHYKTLRHEVMTCDKNCKPEFVAQALHYKLLELEAQKLSPGILSERPPTHPTREQEREALEKHLSKKSQECVRTLVRQDKAKFTTSKRLLLRSQYISKDLQLKQLRNDLKTSSNKPPEAIKAQIESMQVIEEELQQIARSLNKKPEPLTPPHLQASSQ